MEESGDRPLVHKVDCVRFYVPDLEASLAYYRDRLGHRLICCTVDAAGLAMPGSDAEIVLQTKSREQEVDLSVASADGAAVRVEARGAIGWSCWTPPPACWKPTARATSSATPHPSGLSE